MPEARYKHTAHISCNSLMILGGVNQTKRFGPPHAFQSQGQRWSIIKTKNNELFQGRYFHSTAHNPSNGDVYVFGGSDSKGKKLSDIHYLSLPATEAHSNNILSVSEGEVISDMAKLINYCESDHLASDLELSVRNSEDQLIGKFYTYLGLFRVRMP